MNAIIQQPNDESAERAALGSCLIDPDAVRRVGAIVKPEDFYIVKHQWVMSALLKLRGTHQPIDSLTVCAELEARKQLAELGGAAFINSLMLEVPTAINADGYANIVANLAVDRRMIQAASKIAQLAYDGETSRQDKIAQAVNAIKSAQPETFGHLRHISQVSGELVNRVNEWSENPLCADEVRGMSTGFPSVDKLTGGLLSGEQTVVIGRTGVGKSAFAFEVALNAAEHGHPVAIISLEMGRDSVVYRLIAHRVGVTWQDIQRANMTGDQWQRFYAECKRVENLPIYINDRPRQTLARIESDIAAIDGCKLFVVDHLRLVGEKPQQKESEITRLGRVSMALREIAREYNAHNLLVAQMNRAADGRDDKRPSLSDIRQSGEIEENADNVWGLYREDYYNKQTLHRGIVEVWPLKNRNGDTSTPAELEFDARFTHFKRMERQTL